MSHYADEHCLLADRAAAAATAAVTTAVLQELIVGAAGEESAGALRQSARRGEAPPLEGARGVAEEGLQVQWRGNAHAEEGRTELAGHARGLLNADGADWEQIAFVFNKNDVGCWWIDFDALGPLGNTIKWRTVSDGIEDDADASVRIDVFAEKMKVLKTGGVPDEQIKTILKRVNMVGILMEFGT